MAMKTVNVEVDEMKFSISTFGARKGINIKQALLKYALPFMLLREKDKTPQEIREQGYNENNMDKFIKSIESKLDDKLIGFIVKLLSETTYNNQKIDETLFDEIFSANYMTMYKLIWEVIKVNNFLPKMITSILVEFFQTTKILLKERDISILLTA